MAGKRLGILRARPGLVDAGAALLLSAFAVATLPPHVNPAAAAACGLAATSSVGWRNRAPGIAVVIAGAGLAGYAWRTSSSSAFAEPLALILVMYTAGARGSPGARSASSWRWSATGSRCASWSTRPQARSASRRLAVHALPLAIAPAVAGFLVARQRALARRLAAATERLRAGEQARLAVVRIRERNRVARDPARRRRSRCQRDGGAGRGGPDYPRWGTGPGPCRAGGGVGGGRAGLSELRRILGVIGGEDHDSPEPPFGVAGIAALAESRRAGGLPVEVTVTGTDPGFPAEVDAALYRIAQETLTNVIKHARSAPTDVDVVIEPAVVRVRVRNSAPPSAAQAGPGTAETSPAGTSTAGPGHGLAGMRERVESCGGQLWYGALPGGGFEVRAQFPLIPAGEEGPRWPGRLTGWLRVIGPCGVALRAPRRCLCRHRPEGPAGAEHRAGRRHVGRAAVAPEIPPRIPHRRQPPGPADQQRARLDRQPDPGEHVHIRCPGLDGRGLVRHRHRGRRAGSCRRFRHRGGRRLGTSEPLQ